MSSLPLFWGKVAFNAVGLGVGPQCLRVDSEETLLKWTDERAPLARAALGVTPVNKLETKTSVVGRQEPINGANCLKYANQMTASVWTPFKQTHEGESGDADFDSFKTAPWDAGGIQGDRFHEVMCRTIVHELDRWTTRNTECELITNMLIDTDSPRLTVTPDECHAKLRRYTDQRQFTANT